MNKYKVNSSCPKCGDDKASTSYHNNIHRDPPCFIGGEHIHRTCSRCGYSWAELCLDAKPEVIASSTNPKGYEEVK